MIFQVKPINPEMPGQVAAQQSMEATCKARTKRWDDCRRRWVGNPNLLGVCCTFITIVTRWVFAGLGQSTPHIWEGVLYGFTTCLWFCVYMGLNSWKMLDPRQVIELTVARIFITKAKHLCFLERVAISASAHALGSSPLGDS